MRNPTSKTTPCCTKIGLKRGPWTPDEDELLANYIHKEGEGRWRTLPKHAGLLRCGKSCRLRWMNYLRPSVKRGQIDPDEEDLILRLHRLLGNRWSLIAGRIPGRTDNEIKNYWNTHLSKKLINQGIDPRTHKPLDLESSTEYKASSSRAANRVVSSPNLNPKPATHKETGNGSPIIIKNDNGYIQIEPYQADKTTNLQSSNEEEDDINYTTDDVFSSFLNSLINEEPFTSHHHYLQQQTVGVAPVSDPLISISASTFGIGENYESAMISPAFKQNDPKSVVNDNVD